MSLSQLYQPPRIAFSQITYQWLLSSCEYCKVFKNGLFYRTPPKVVFAVIPQTFRKLHRKALKLESLFKKLAGLQLHKKRLQHRCVHKFAKLLRTTFLKGQLR